MPDELLPRLVEKLHGKADKREDVVNAFVAMYPHCTKKAVRPRINSGRSSQLIVITDLIIHDRHHRSSVLLIVLGDGSYPIDISDRRL